MRALTIILVILCLCPIALASQDQNAAAEQGIFGGTFADAVWTVLAFVVLLLVLGKIAWKPMLNTLKTRQQHIQQQIEAAEIARKRAEKMLEDYKQQGLQILKQVTDQAQKQGLELAEKTRREMLEIRRKAQQDIEYAHHVASEQLWDQATDIVLAMSCEILGRTITKEDNQQLINEAIVKLKQ